MEEQTTVSDGENPAGIQAPAGKRLARLWQGLHRDAWPAARRRGLQLYAALRAKVWPAACRQARGLCTEAVTLYRNHAWLQRCGSTLNKKAIGLGIAMLSAKMVSNMVETRQVSNLWGLLANRPVVSETTFTVLIFVVEYVVALIVFALIDHYVAAYQRRRMERSTA